MTPERIQELRDSFYTWCKPETRDEVLAEIQRMQRYEPLAKDILYCIVDAFSNGGYEMDVEQLADIAVKHGMVEWVPYDPDEHGELPSCDPEPGDMIYWFDRSNLP